MTWSGWVGSVSMDWRRKLRFRRRIWPSSVLTLKERGASCFSTTMAGCHVRPRWTVTGTPVWSAGRALVPRLWCLFCLCCLASKDLCKSSATFGDRRLAAVDSLPFNTRLISNCAGEYSRPDTNVFLYAKRAKCISRPSSDAFTLAALLFQLISHFSHWMGPGEDLMSQLQSPTLRQTEQTHCSQMACCLQWLCLVCHVFQSRYSGVRSRSLQSLWITGRRLDIWKSNQQLEDNLFPWMWKCQSLVLTMDALGWHAG